MAVRVPLAHAGTPAILDPKRKISLLELQLSDFVGKSSVPTFTPSCLFHCTLQQPSLHSPRCSLGQLHLTPGHSFCCQPPTIHFHTQSATTVLSLVVPFALWPKRVTLIRALNFSLLSLSLPLTQLTFVLQYLSSSTLAAAKVLHPKPPR